MADKFTALWVSHSSISDFLNCPRSYYLKNMYKDPKTKSKMKIVSPALSLGSAVHSVLESLSVLPVEDRFSKSLMSKFDDEWQKYTGKKGGFFSEETEIAYKKRGEEMIKKVIENPGPLKTLAVKINMDLPFYWLSESEGIILCGKIDWLEYLEESDSVNIIDFKTSMKKEDKESLQLPIYHLLVKNCQNRGVSSASYWYLEIENHPEEVALPDLDSSYDDVYKIAKKIKIARQLDSLECPNGEDGCQFCKPFESILRGEGEHVGKDNYGADIYVLKYENEEEENREGTLL